MRLLLIVLGLLFLCGANSQEIDWSFTAGGQWTEGGHKIVVDDNGNSYIGGSINSLLNYSFSFGGIELDPIHSPSRELFIAKLDKNGQALWAKPLGGFFSDQLWSMALDTYDNIWLTASGDFEVQVDSFTLTTPNGVTAYALKFDTDGHFLWGRFWDQMENSEAYMLPYCVCADHEGAVYYSGTFFSDSLVIDSFILHKPLNTIATLYLIKLNQQGDIIWARTNTSGGFSVKDCTIDHNNDLYLFGGNSDQEVSFDSISINGQSNGFSDPVLFKFNTDGKALWGRTGTGSFADFATVVAVDQEDAVYISGDFNSRSLTFGNQTLLNTKQGGDPNEPTTYDSFITKYDHNGNLQWTSSFGGTKDEGTTDLAIDQNNQILLSGGSFSPSLSIGNQVMYNAQEDKSDFFLFSFSPEGIYNEGFMAGGKENDGMSSIAVDQQNNIYFTGGFISDTLSLGSFTHPNSYPPGNSPTGDILISKLSSLTTAISEPQSNQQYFQLSPNPVSETVTIELSKEVPKANWILNIYDITGLIRKTIPMKGQRKLQLLIDDLESGTFFILIQNNQNVSYQTKMIVIR